MYEDRPSPYMPELPGLPELPTIIDAQTKGLRLQGTLAKALPPMAKVGYSSNVRQMEAEEYANDMRAALRLGKLVNSNQNFSYRALAQVARSVPQRVKFETLDFNGSDQIIITGLAFSDQDIINFISNLNAKALVELASLQAMNVPQNTGDLQAASNKKGFTILCKLKIS